MSLCGLYFIYFLKPIFIICSCFFIDIKLHHVSYNIIVFSIFIPLKLLAKLHQLPALFQRFPSSKITQTVTRKERVQQLKLQWQRQRTHRPKHIRQWWTSTCERWKWPPSLQLRYAWWRLMMHAASHQSDSLDMILHQVGRQCKKNYIGGGQGIATWTCTLRGRRGTYGTAIVATAVGAAGMALGNVDLHFAWHAWHLATWTCTLRGRRGACGTGLALVVCLVPSWRRCRRGCTILCPSQTIMGRPPMERAGMANGFRSLLTMALAGIQVHGVNWPKAVALGDIDLQFEWQAWRLATSASALRGKRGTWWHGLALSVASTAIMALDWLWWRAWFPVQAWHLATSAFTLRGRRGASWHGPALCVAGVALMALGWLWWRAWLAVDAVVAAAVGLAGVALPDTDLALMALGLLWWRAWFPVDAVVAAAVGVTGVALGDIDLHFAWQAWALATWTCTLRGRRATYGTGLALVARFIPSWRRCRRGCWRGSRGAWRHRLSLCVAGMALMALDWLWWPAWFPVQAWHLATSNFTLRGRSGASWHGPALCVAGVALGDIDLQFAWQAWRLATSASTLCGKCGTWWHRLTLSVAGAAIMALDWLWWRAWFPVQAWHLATSTFTLRGRRGASWHGPALCVAGVALMALGWLWWRAWLAVDAVVAAAVGLAGMALPDMDLALMALGWLWWSAWFPVDAVVAAAVGVAAVVLGDIDFHFAWQAWH